MSKLGVRLTLRMGLLGLSLAVAGGLLGFQIIMCVGVSLYGLSALFVLIEFITD